MFQNRVLKVELARVGGGGHAWWEPSGWWGLHNALSHGDWSQQLSVSHDICLQISPSRRTGSLWPSLLLVALPPNPSDWALNFNVTSCWGHSDYMADGHFLLKTSPSDRSHTTCWKLSILPCMLLRSQTFVRPEKTSKSYCFLWSLYKAHSSFLKRVSRRNPVDELWWALFGFRGGGWVWAALGPRWCFLLMMGTDHLVSMNLQYLLLIISFLSHGKKKGI